MMNLCRTVLETLKPCGDYALPEETLHSSVNLRLAESVTLTQLKEALGELEAKTQVVSVKDEDKGRMWKITAHGRARLAS